MTPHLGRLSAARFLDYLRERLPGPGIVITPAGAPTYAATPYPDGIGTLPPSYRSDQDAVLPRAVGAGAEVARAAWAPLGSFLAQQATIAHEADALLIGQIHHPGAERSWDAMQPSVAPSASDGEWPTQRPHELTDAEVDELVAAYVANAAWIVATGADGVEVHAAHGYLLNRFLSPYYNRRVGRYGGDNRWAVMHAILAGIRTAIGPRAVLGVRLPAWEQVEGGLTSEDVAAGAAGCAQWLSYINLSLGNHDGLAAGRPVLAYTTPWLVERPSLSAAAAMVRAAADVPMLVTGGVTSAADVEALLAGGADLVGIARAVIADAGFARKVLAGDGAAIAECVGCNECTYVPFSCPVNPAAGREAELRITPAVARRTVAVVGAGPAGLAAALAAAQRGHRVTVYDRAPRLGGRLAELVRDPARARWTSWLDRLPAQATARLDVRLDLAVDDSAALEADVIVWATGAVPAPPGFSTDGSAAVLTSSDVLAGARPPGPVLVVGGTEPHVDPLLTARLLAADGLSVRVVSELVTIAPAVERRTLNHLLRLLSELGVEVATSTQVAEIAGGAARTVALLSGRTTEVPVGAVVLAHTRRPDPLATRIAVRGQERPVYIVGDALAPRRLTHAVLEGARFGASL
jgi:2,4-dienoyl-CoA reductase-like NADH-dependent reductase (Old Yellow Enzyme family)/thioredoxin reductase